MNYKAIALGSIIGISGPLIGTLVDPPQALAQAFNYPEGTYVDRDWAISLYFYNNAYVYYGENQNSGSNITLSGAVTSGTSQRQVYTWNNAGTRYRVTWRPSDPNYIRVEVINPNNRVILNRLLTRSL